MRTGELNSLNGGLIIVLITMIVLSWQVTVIALVLLAAYLLLAKWVAGSCS